MPQRQNPTGSVLWLWRQASAVREVPTVRSLACWAQEGSRRRTSVGTFRRCLASTSVAVRSSALGRPTVVITGASAGIGRATAIAFARRGWAIALLACGRGRLESARRQVEKAGGQALVVPADVADPEAIARAAERIFDELGAALTCG